MTSSSTTASTVAVLGSKTLGTSHAQVPSFTGSMMSGQTGAPVVPNLAQMVALKLSRDNYLLWKAQIVPILRGHQLLGFLDGWQEAPPIRVTVSTEEGANLGPNPAYRTWYVLDQLLLQAIISMHYRNRLIRRRPAALGVAAPGCQHPDF
jgi:hypothetical protein